MSALTTIVVIIVVLYLLSSIKILAEYERGVIFRLGRLLTQPKGPGIILVFTPIDRLVRISLRIETIEVPPQDVVTRDNVTVKVNAVIFFRVIDPRLAVVEVNNFLYATSQLSQTTLRSVLGEAELDELLSEREKLNLRLQSILDQHTAAWGVKVLMVEVKQVDLAEQMIRAIGRQAEAEGYGGDAVDHQEPVCRCMMQCIAQKTARDPSQLFAFGGGEHRYLLGEQERVWSDGVRQFRTQG